MFSKYLLAVLKGIWWGCRGITGLCVNECCIAKQSLLVTTMTEFCSPTTDKSTAASWVRFAMSSWFSFGCCFFCSCPSCNTEYTIRFSLWISIMQSFGEVRNDHRDRTPYRSPPISGKGCRNTKQKTKRKGKGLRICTETEHKWECSCVNNTYRARILHHPEGIKCHKSCSSTL